MLFNLHEPVYLILLALFTTLTIAAPPLPDTSPCAVVPVLKRNLPIEIRHFGSTQLYEPRQPRQTRTVAEDLQSKPLQLSLQKRQPLPPHCPTKHGIHVIAASGDGSANIAQYGLIGTLVGNITAAIPGSTNVTLDYHKASTHNVRKTEGGSENLLKYLREYHGKCPKARIVLAGYSAGAVITMNALCGASEEPWKTPTEPLSAIWTKRIIGTIIYADETYSLSSQASYNYGPCVGPGRFPRLNTTACAPFAPSIQSYCNDEDPQCCKGFVPEEHYTYPEKYDGIATAFIVKRHKHALKVERERIAAKKAKVASV